MNNHRRKDIWVLVDKENFLEDENDGMESRKKATEMLIRFSLCSVKEFSKTFDRLGGSPLRYDESKGIFIHASNLDQLQNNEFYIINPSISLAGKVIKLQETIYKNVGGLSDETKG